MSYKPALPFNVPAQLLKGSYDKVNGVLVKTFTDDALIFVSARSFGGTENQVNDKLTITDTMTIETWYRPDITSMDAIKLLDDNSVWEIMNSPENIERRNQWLKFKAQRRKGDA